MYIDTCCKCGSGNLYLFRKGNNLGLYCSECGSWQTWVGKKDYREYEVHGVPLYKEQPLPKVNARKNMGYDSAFAGAYQSYSAFGAQTKDSSSFLAPLGISCGEDIKNGSEVNFGAPMGMQKPKAHTEDLPFDLDEPVKESLVPAEGVKSEAPKVIDGSMNFVPLFDVASQVSAEPKRSCGCEMCKSGKAVLFSHPSGDVCLVDGVLAISTNDGLGQLSEFKYCPYCGSSFMQKGF